MENKTKKIVKKTTKKTNKIHKKMTFAEIIKEHPEAGNILAERGMFCCGCPMAMMETIEEGAAAHNANIDELIDELNKYSEKCRLFSNLKTFEYDLALEGDNLKFILEIISEKIVLDGKLRKEVNHFKTEDWSNKNDIEKSDVAYWILCRLENAYPIGKGEFAQILSTKLSKGEIVLSVPEYIELAIKWVIGINEKTVSA